MCPAYHMPSMHVFFCVGSNLFRTCALTCLFSRALPTCALPYQIKCQNLRYWPTKSRIDKQHVTRCCTLKTTPIERHDWGSHQAHHDSNHNIRYLTKCRDEEVDSLCLVRWVNLLHLSFVIFGPVTECLGVLWILWFHWSKAKYMSNDQSTVLAVLSHGALTYFDLQTWIHRDESSFITVIRLWGWLTCGDLVGDFLNYLTSIQIISIQEGSLIHSSRIISNHLWSLDRQMSRNFSPVAAGGVVGPRHLQVMFLEAIG